jgi:hypothetical protein
MPHFDQHGGDQWICQKCLSIFDSTVNSEWRPDITGNKCAGNVCPSCLAKHDGGASNTTRPAPLATDMRGALKPGLRKAYALGGHATITVMNPGTGQRFTFKVNANPERAGQYWVKLMNGPDNQNDYAYMGVIDHRGFHLTGGSKVTAEAPSYKVMDWLHNRNHWEDTRIEMWHDGRCGRCGRPLTVPESIESGIGPVCAGRAA